MAFFRRKQDSVSEQTPAGQTEETKAVQESTPAATGPFDDSEVDGHGERLDLGAIWLPGKPGLELRMEVDSKTQRVTGVAVALNGSILQIQVFAAPKTLGIWDEIREEIAQSISSQGGIVDDVPGNLGRELLVKLPVKMPDGSAGVQPARFVGHDGPRWFLRGVFSGRAAFDPEAATDLEDIFRNIVVVRGSDPRPPRDPLTLPIPGQLAPRPNEFRHNVLVQVNSLRVLLTGRM